MKVNLLTILFILMIGQYYAQCVNNVSIDYRDDANGEPKLKRLVKQ